MIQHTTVLTVEDLISDEFFDPNNFEGYIYMTTNLETGRSYIGKKSFFHKLNKKLGKKELANLPVTRGRTKTTKLVVKSSDWKNYYGSAQEIKEDLKKYPKDKFTRVVLKLCKTKKELTYYECKYLFQYGVLEDRNTWINDNILGKFYTSDFKGPTE
jgi:hypothetical protein